MMNINISSDLKKLTAKLSGLAIKQIPFAKAQAVNAVAALAQQAEQRAIKSTFNNPTPFTQNSIAVKKATKSNAVATVFVRPVAAKYLAPYEDGGVHFLAGKAFLNPKDIKLNQYNQLPKNVLAALKARPDIFIGPVKTKTGMVNGVWQRPYLRGQDTSKALPLAMRKKLRGQGKQRRGANTTGKLKLLIRFGDAIPVTKELHYGSTAKLVVEANLGPEFAKALAKAMT